MKSKFQYATGLVSLSLMLPSAADIIYGSLQQIIPTDYTGVTVNVGDGTLNPFFGGADVANNNNLCLLYTSPSPRDRQKSRMPSSA